MKGVSEVEQLAPPVQVRLSLTGRPDAGRLQATCQNLANRNGDSRVHTGHNGNGQLHSGLTSPLRLAWQEHDLRGLSDQEVRAWIESFLEIDSSQRIPGDRMSTMRCALMHISDDASELVWSFHPAWEPQIDVARLGEAFARE